ncbi:reverse transcriptase [Corchorus capsularis]|uniref:Reverse transcriptase n=1 Tax=Corchorus capsularis TaxID=210143 RepID=A0A1R3IQK0_COCAP|nr:reverse transcriptase [Corchorus capsularis]
MESTPPASPLVTDLADEAIRRSKKKYKKRRVKEGPVDGLDKGEEELDTEIPTPKVPLESSNVSYKDRVTGSVPVQESTWEDWTEIDEGDDSIMFEDSVSDGEEGEDSDSRGRFSVEEKRELRKPWKNALIVKLLGKILGFKALSSRVQQLWRIEGKYRIIDLGNDYFCFKFQKRGDYKHVLDGCPWVIGGHQLTVRQWTHNFKPNSNVIKSIVAWIRLPQLPLEYYTNMAIRRIASKVGRVIRLDKTTESVVRGGFARVCVELDLSVPLRSSVVETSTNASFGPWMIFQRRGRRPVQETVEKGKSTVRSDPGHDSRNCFNHLKNVKEDLVEKKKEKLVEEFSSVKKGPFKYDRKEWKPKKDYGINITSKSSGKEGFKAKSKGVASFSRSNADLPKAYSVFEPNKVIGPPPGFSFKAGDSRPVTFDAKRLVELVGSKLHGPVMDGVMETSTASLTTMPSTNEGASVVAKEFSKSDGGKKLTSDPSILPPQNPPSNVSCVPAVSLEEKEVEGNEERGLGYSNFRRTCKELLKLYKPEVLCLLETKANTEVVKRVAKYLRFSDYFEVPTEGMAGGIVLFWNAATTDLTVHSFSTQIIHTSIVYKGVQHMVSFAYVRPQTQFKDIFWRDLKDFSVSISSSWIVLGDFNDFASLKERWGGKDDVGFLINRVLKFRNRWNDCNLLDAGSSGSKFTWRRRVGGRVVLQEKLDRVLWNLVALTELTNAKIMNLPCLCSDYHPILLDFNCIQKAPLENRLVRFEAAWLTHPEFSQVFAAAWSRGEGSLSRAIAEVTKDVQAWKGLKAPGVDGIQPIFYQRNWVTVKESLLKFVDEAITSGKIDVNLLHAHMVLIPKGSNPTSVKDFRPITLLNTCYKILSKVLVNRMRPILQRIIGPFQNSFLAGRSTTDNILITQEIVHTLSNLKGRKGAMILKIDLQKAYDNVSWEFLHEVLNFFGFPTQLISLIMFCVTNIDLSIIWNGKALPSFKPQQGLRQGDPLSPYLFILAMERLSHMILERVDRKQWVPVKSCRSGPKLSHLFFADDLMLFGPASEEQVNLIMDVLLDFGKASGLEMNLLKSKLWVSPNISKQQAGRLSSLCGIPLGQDLGTYLGVPIIHTKVTRSTYSYVIDRVLKKLANWKGKVLSYAGRRTLIQSSLSSIPVYTMQTALLPVSVCEKLDQVSRNFLWGGDVKNSHDHLVNWDRVCRPKGNGGLGLRKARLTNVAMLAKTWWKLQMRQHSLYTEIFEEKYLKGVEFVNSKYTSRQSSTWRGDGPLINHVLSSDADSFARDTKVASILTSDGEWDLNALRPFLSNLKLEEIRAIRYFTSSLEGDRCAWAWDKSGCFTTKSAYGVLANLFRHDDLAVRSRKGLTTEIGCSLCEGDVETIDHILRGCPFAEGVWSSLYRRYGLDARSHQEFRVWMRSNATRGTPSIVLGSQSVLWDLLFVSVLWSLWKARNKMVFQGIVPNADSVVAYAVKLAQDSAMAWNAGFRNRCQHRGTTDSLSAELWGIRQGLLMAKSMNIASLVIEMDADVVVQFLKDQLDSSHPCYTLVRDCYEIIQGVSWCDEPPVQLLPLLEDDRIGEGVLRP